MPRKWHPQMPAYLGPSVKVPESLLSWFISRNFVSDMTECLAQLWIPHPFWLFPVAEKEEGFFPSLTYSQMTVAVLHSMAP